MEKLIAQHKGINYPVHFSTHAERQAIYDRLADYENIGLEPDDIIELDTLYFEKCVEINELKKEIMQLKEKLND